MRAKHISQRVSRFAIQLRTAAEQNTSSRLGQTCMHMNFQLEAMGPSMSKWHRYDIRTRPDQGLRTQCDAFCEVKFDDSDPDVLWQAGRGWQRDVLGRLADRESSIA